MLIETIDNSDMKMAMTTHTSPGATFTQNITYQWHDISTVKLEK